MLFDKDSREALKRLKERALGEAQFDRKIIDALPVGGTTRTISPEKIKELHASDDFKMILLIIVSNIRLENCMRNINKY
jgi:hypothetical protein